MEGDIPDRPNGVLVSMIAGRVVAYGLDTLQERAELFVAPGDEVYEGMIVGENSRNEDMSVNPTEEKKLTNMRACGTDKNILLKPPRDHVARSGPRIHRRGRAASKSRRRKSACARESSKKPTAAAPSRQAESKVGSR